MSAGNQTPAAAVAAELAVVASPAIHRRLHPDPIDQGRGLPLVVQYDESGQLIKILCEADDDYAAELEIATRTERESRDGVRKASVKSTDIRALVEEAIAASKATAPKTPATRFTPRIPNLTAPRPSWIVKGVVPEKSLVMLYGRHGTGKSTLAIELGVDAALGSAWHGRKMRQGTVVYIASENAHGFRARLDALLRDKEITLDALDSRFLELTSRPHLLKPTELLELIAELKPLKPSLVIFDTLARAAAGSDENSAQEMGVLVENCQTIINQTGATVMLLHHTGKDASKGARGSSAIPGAVDSEIYLERPDENESLRVAHIGKMRDGPDYYTLFRYTLDTVQLGIDEDGDKITSTVVRELPSDPVGTAPVVKLPNTPVRCAIRAALGDSQRAMPFEELITATKAKLSPPDPGEPDRRRDRIKATYERMLADRELYVAANGDVSPFDPAMPFKPVEADQHSDLVGGSAA